MSRRFLIMLEAYGWADAVVKAYYAGETARTREAAVQYWPAMSAIMIRERTNYWFRPPCRIGAGLPPCPLFGWSRAPPNDCYAQSGPVGVSRSMSVPHPKQPATIDPASP